MTIRDELRRFVVENFLFGQTDHLPSDAASFLEEGVIDSTGVLELVGFLEQRFGIRVQDGDLIPENLDSIDNLVAFIEGRAASAA
jgi:acyl carrier protein